MDSPTTERHRAFWFHFQANSDPIHNRQVNSDQQAIEFAKLLIQSLLILHGGALLAFPALVAFFTRAVFDEQPTILAIMILFALGIALALFAGISGFFAMAKRADAHAEEIYALVNASWRYVAEIEMEKEQPDGRIEWKDWVQTLTTREATHRSKVDPLFRKFWNHRTNGILAIIFSFACFVLACSIAAGEVYR
jgi:hypothetical protein